MSGRPFFADGCDIAPAVEAPCSGVRLRTATASGFTIHNTKGAVLATVENFEDALAIQRELDAGEQVRRVSDGALCATKHRLKPGRHIYSWAWGLKRDPAWVTR